jgi:uncharacterized protein
MRLEGGERMYSPTDLVTFLGCQYATTLALQVLEQSPGSPKPTDALGELIKEKGLYHERMFLEELRSQYPGEVVEIASNRAFVSSSSWSR